jgi:hypothetical protein
MTARELLSALAARGVILGVQDGCVTYRAPAGVLSDADRAALGKHKPELLKLLAAACLDCSGPLPPGHLYRCKPCTIAAWWRVYGAAPYMAEDDHPLQGGPPEAA